MFDIHNIRPVLRNVGLLQNHGCFALLQNEIVNGMYFAHTIARKIMAQTGSIRGKQIGFRIPTGQILKVDLIFPKG
jgi:hypothetical protein